MPETTTLDTATSLAAFLNCSTAKIRKDTRLTDMPVIKIGRSGRYDRSAVLDWLKQRGEEKNR